MTVNTLDCGGATTPLAYFFNNLVKGAFVSKGAPNPHPELARKRRIEGLTRPERESQKAFLPGGRELRPSIRGFAAIQGEAEGGL